MIVVQLKKEELDSLIQSAVQKALQQVPHATNQGAEEFLSIKEACQLLKISKPSLYKMLEAGTIDSIKVGHRRLFHKETLLRSIKGEQND